MSTDPRIVSADDHVNPPPTMYAERVPAQWRSRMPRIERRGDRDLLVFEGSERPISLLEGSAGVASKDVQLLAKSRSEGRRGGWDPAARIEDMDLDGVDAQVLFGSGAGGGVAIRSLERPLQLVMMRAYNEWLAEFCRAFPRRLIGIGEIPVFDLDAALDEARRCAKLGLRGVLIPAVPATVESPPGDRSYLDPAYEPLWAALEELGLPIHFHLGARPVSRGIDQNLMALISVNKTVMCEPIAAFVFSGVLQRHPGLRLVSVESGIGWMAFLVPWMDHVFERHRWHTKSELREPPSFYFHRQVLGTFIEDVVGVRNRDVIGVENIMWSSDYPHVNSSWPESRLYIEKHFAEVPAEERSLMVGGNAARLYGI